MWLLTFSEWKGPNREVFSSEERQRIRDVLSGHEITTVSYFTAGDLEDALRLIRDYQKAFNAWSPKMAINLTLIGASQIPGMSTALLEDMGVRNVLDIPVQIEGFRP